VLVTMKSLSRFIALNLKSIFFLQFGFFTLIIIDYFFLPRISYYEKVTGVEVNGNAGYETIDGLPRAIKIIQVSAESGRIAIFGYTIDPNFGLNEKQERVIFNGVETVAVPQNINSFSSQEMFFKKNDIPFFDSIQLDYTLLMRRLRTVHLNGEPQSLCKGFFMTHIIVLCVIFMFNLMLFYAINDVRYPDSKTYNRVFLTSMVLLAVWALIYDLV
jgi:hypothetical protein